MNRIFGILSLLLVLTGCTSGGGSKEKKLPVFSLAWSEYPSWSVFGVAHDEGLINGKENELGQLEKVWEVDIVLTQADYEPCLQLYGSNKVDAVCITNIDGVAACLTNPGVMVVPTSTSVGGDAVIVVGIDSVDQLKDNPTYGLEKTVAQYNFDRNLILAGKNPEQYTFKQMDPGVAAQAMVGKQDNINSIAVWNPYLMQTLGNRPEAKALMTSASIPEEIVDGVVVSKAVLKRPGGDKFAGLILDTVYSVNRMIADPKTSDKTLVALGAKFSSLQLKEMKKVVEQTQFYKTPKAAIDLFESKKFREDTPKHVVKFYKDHSIVEPASQESSEKWFGFEDDGDQALIFSTKYLKAELEKKN